MVAAISAVRPPIQAARLAALGPSSQSAWVRAIM